MLLLKLLLSLLLLFSCDKFYYKLRLVLQGAVIITKCDRTVTQASKKWFQDRRTKWKKQMAPDFEAS